MKGGVEVMLDIDWNAIRGELERRTLDAQATLDLAIINDSDAFVPMRQGTLAGSVALASQVGKGVIVYDTPYARHLYYGVNVKTGRPFQYSKAKHPQASERWVEQAKSLYLAKWLRQIQEVYSR